MGEMTSDLRTLTSLLVERMVWMRQHGVSFDGKRDLYVVLGYPRVLTNKDYREEYARGGIAKRIVEAYPKATWRGGTELQEDEDPKVTTAFEEAWGAFAARLKVWAKLQSVDILSGLSTYSVLLIGAPGELDTELPKGNSQEQLLYLSAFSGGGGPAQNGQRNTVGADYVDATIRDFDIDPQSKRFGEPLTYQLRRLDATTPTFAKPVHWSRIIHIAEGCLDNEVYGIPRLEAVWNLLQDLLKTTGGGAEAFWLRANGGINLNLQKGAELSTTAQASLKDEIDEYLNGMSRVIKTREMDVNRLGSDVANFSNPADAILTQIAGTLGIPKRMLMGSEMGQLASGQDADNWIDQVQDRRTSYAGPYIVCRLADRLIEYGYLPKPKSYEVKWPNVESMTETEKAEGAKSWAATNQTQGAPVYTVDEIRQKWYRMEPLTDEQKQALADEAAAKMEQQQAAVAPPQPEVVPGATEAAVPAADKAPVAKFPRAAGDGSVELVGLGGEGSGWTAENGHVPGSQGGNGEQQSSWTPGGTRAGKAAVSKTLEKAGIQLSTMSKPQYTHTGQLYGGGSHASRGVSISGTIDTRVSYSFGSSTYSPSDSDRAKASAEIGKAREALHAAGFETRELSFLKNNYEVQKPPKVARGAEGLSDELSDGLDEPTLEALEAALVDGDTDEVLRMVGLGGPGSGWTAEGGHMPGATGGFGSPGNDEARKDEQGRWVPGSWVRHAILAGEGRVVSSTDTHAKVAWERQNGKVSEVKHMMLERGPGMKIDRERAKAAAQKAADERAREDAEND
jgi:hypothetical protein